MTAISRMLCATVFTLIALGLNAQTWEVPKNYELKKKEDYAKYEKDVISCVNWLESTPLDQEADKRKEANAFLLVWISGSPNVTVEINSNVLTTDKNKEFLMIFLGGWTKFALENPASANDKYKGALAGVKSVIKVYKAGKGVKKDKDVDKLVKMTDAELEKWVTEQMNKK